MSFASLPYFVAQPYARNKILNSVSQAYTGVRRWLLLGDSQETAPGGAGSVYIPTISRAFQAHFGNRAETGWLPQGSYGSGSPPSLFLSRGAISGGADVVMPTELLPGFSLRTYSNAHNGALWMNLPDGSLLATASPTRQWFQDPTGNIQFEILCKGSTTGGSEFAWYFRSPSTNVAAYFAPAASHTGTSTLSLAVDNNFKKQTVTVPQHVTDRFGQINVNGSSATAVQICSCRIRHQNAVGIALTSSGAGGYKVADVLANHANAGPFVSAIGPFDLVVLQFGANDSGTSVTAAQYKTNLLALIAAMRGWLGSDQTFLIVPDIARTALTGTQETALADYNLVAKEITDTDANVAFLNLRRLTNDRFGWTTAGGTWLADTVHLTAEAQLRLGELFVNSMMAVSDSDNAAVISKLNEIQIDVRNVTV